LGITIAKKQVKRAYQRNRCKRLLRESFRHRQHRLPAMDFIAIAKKGIEALDNPHFTALVAKLWQRYSPQPVGSSP
jgi:ribonuclease P protein component